MRWPEQWRDASRLELIRDTPVNCLVGRRPPPFPLGDLEFVKDGEAPGGVTLREGAWPRVRASAEPGDVASAGPTGGPWVESNAGLIRLARALEPAKRVWLTYAPPPANEIIRFDEMHRSVAEAGAYGARWVIALHDSLRRGLENSTEAALGAWQNITATLEFNRKHSEWEEWSPVAALALVSPFAGESDFLAREFVNLAPRKDLALRIVPASGFASASFKEQTAILYVGDNAPRGAVAAKLLRFAREGGLLILPEKPGAVTGAPVEKNQHLLYRFGQGRVAVPRQEWYDPYVLVTEAHSLIGRRRDVIRIWNGGALNTYLLTAPGCDRGVIHLVRYGQPKLDAQDVTLGLAGRYRRARIRTQEGVREVEIVERRLGVEIPLPHFSVFAAVELEM